MHSHCEAGEYCYDAGACSQCFDNNACSIYGNSIDGDCSKCQSGTQSSSGTPSSSGTQSSSGITLNGLLGLISAIMVASALAQEKEALEQN